MRAVITIQGFNHLLDVGLRNATQVDTWYILLFENEYTPTQADVMATFPSLAGELTQYVAPFRPELVLPTAPAGGVVSNAASVAEITFTGFTGTKQVRGAAIVSAAAKGATAGILMAAAQFPSPKPVTSGDVLRVTGGLQLL